VTENQQTSDETTTEETRQNQWETILKDFQVLGENIAENIKNAWQDENTQKQFSDLRTGLQTVVDQVSDAIDEARQAATSEEVKTEVKKAAGEVKELGAKVYTDTKPHLVNTLKTLSDGLQGIISRLESPANTSTQPEGQDQASPEENS